MKLRALPPSIEMPLERPLPARPRVRPLGGIVQVGMRNESRGVLVTDLLSGRDGPYDTEKWFQEARY